MKIVDEYEIVLQKKKLSIFQCNPNLQNASVLNVRSKSNSTYIEIDYELPSENFSLFKSKIMKTKNILKCSSYAIKLNNTNKLYVGKILHQNKKILLYELDNKYIFEPKMDYLDIAEEEPKEVGFKFLKNENLSEFEYRKKNLNYLLKKINQEQFIEHKYVSEDIEFEDNSANAANNSKAIINDAHLEERRIKERIRKSIYRARVVNLSEMIKIYKDERLVYEVISEMAFPFKGRFVLKDDFYEEYLRNIRKVILKIFLTKEFVIFSDIKDIIKDEIFIVNEICVQKEEKYFLKGFYEEIPSFFEKSLIPKKEKILFVLRKHGVADLKTIITESKISEVEAKEVLNIECVKLASGSYCIKDDNEVRNAIIDLLSKKSIVKRNEIFQNVLKLTNKDLSNSVFTKMMKEFCTSKGSSWYLK